VKISRLYDHYLWNFIYFILFDNYTPFGNLYKHKYITIQYNTIHYNIVYYYKNMCMLEEVRTKLY
jgi:hypothetical protein